MPRETLDSLKRLPFILTNLVVLVASIALLAACTDDETSTQQPISTATPTVAPTQIPPTPAPTQVPSTPTPTQIPPTPTPTQVPPTPTPTSIPPTPTPTQVPVTFENLDITDTTTVRDIMAALSEEEVNCVRDSIGASTFDAVQDVPLTAVPSGTAGFPLECLSPENAVGISIVFMSVEAGGLSAETRGCIRDVAIENPNALGVVEPTVETPEDLVAVIQIHLCLSDEEYGAIASGTDAELPPPSVMQCLVEQLGGLESLAKSFSAEADDDAAFILFAAALDCEETSTVGGIQGFGN